MLLLKRFCLVALAGASIMLAELAMEAGLPDGVLNIVHGTHVCSCQVSTIFYIICPKESSFIFTIVFQTQCCDASMNQCCTSNDIDILNVVHICGRTP